jgi:copper chaperone CopZ
MKNVMLILIVGLALLTSSCGTMKNGKPVKQIVSIQTNAQCGDCKVRIEEELNFTKGIVFADLDLETKKVEVKYNSKKTSPKEIKKKIASIGYSADEVSPNKKAQGELPKCCQPGDHD